MRFAYHTRCVLSPCVRCVSSPCVVFPAIDNLAIHVKSGGSGGFDSDGSSVSTLGACVRGGANAMVFAVDLAMDVTVEVSRAVGLAVYAGVSPAALAVARVVTVCV